MEQRGLSFGKMPRQRQEVCGRGPRPPEPAPQGLDSQLLTLLMSQAKGVDEAALCSVDAQAEPVVDLDGLAAEIKRVLLETVPPDRRGDLRLALGARKGNVDGQGDDVREVVVGQRSGETERGGRGAQGYLDAVEVGRRRGGLAVQAVAQALECPVGNQGAETTF